MGHFDDMIEQKKLDEAKLAEQNYEDEFSQESFYQNYEKEMVEAEKNAGLGEGAEAPDMSSSYINDKIQRRMTQTTFKERTDHYFKNADYLDAKVQRYANIADDFSGEVESFAEKHTNRSAKKRKQKAAKAAECFDKARRLEEKMPEDAGTPLDTYKAREQVMRLRMEGMINAAKVKSTSADNEEYRIAKAKLSCLSILYDQAIHLREKESKDFDKIQTNLKKEIADAQKALKKYDKNSAQWREALGINKESIKKDLKEANNPYATEDSAVCARMLNSMAVEFMRPEYVEAQKHSEEVFGMKMNNRRDPLIAVTYSIKRDKQGTPISKEEKKKEEWNNRWLKACSDPKMKTERKKMIAEAYDRFKRFEIPTPSELKEKGIVHFFKQDPTTYYEMVVMTLRMDNLKEYEPFANELYLNDKVLKKRMDTALYFANIFKNTFSMGLHLDEKKSWVLKVGDEFKDIGENAAEENKELLRTSTEEDLKMYEASYKKIEVAENDRKYADENHGMIQPVNYEKAKEKAAQANVTDFSEEAYNVYSLTKKTGLVLQCPLYRAAYAPVERLLKSGKDLSRVCGAMLRDVHFNENWEPISDKDMAAHEWNIKYLNHLSVYFLGPDLLASEEAAIEEEIKEGKSTYKQDDVQERRDQSNAVLEEMVKEELKRSFSGDLYPLPSPEELKKDLLEPLKNGKPLHSDIFEKVMDNRDAFMSLARKTLTLEGTVKNLPFAEEWLKDHPEIYACQNMYAVFSNLANTYFATKYNVSLNLGTDAEIRKFFFPVEMAEIMLVEYEENYNKYHAMLAGGNA